MSIHILPSYVIKQIAAGQIVERPASVVKELIENSLDAGATRICIDIELGGIKCIRVLDNACGISKSDLKLVLTSYATSKITSLDDLTTINTLGFRGEALASISSVSRITVTSRTAKQNNGWQLYAEKGDVEIINLKPAAHPCGTTVEVIDLFYNTPARKKFLRTARTEFTVIDEIVRQISLAYFKVGISLTHNGQIKRQYHINNKNLTSEKRLSNILGYNFINHAIPINNHKNNIYLNGWFINPNFAYKTSSVQYFYVNHRIVYNRLINNAIRQVVQTIFGVNQPFAYILFLKIDLDQIDINVCPSKKEIRFYQSRLVHDFIYESLITAIYSKNIEKSYFASTKSLINHDNIKEINTYRQYGNHEYAKCHNFLDYEDNKNIPIIPTEISTDLSQSLPTIYKSKFGNILKIISFSFALIEKSNNLMLLSLPVANVILIQQHLQSIKDKLKSQPLLIPSRITLNPLKLQIIKKHFELLLKIGITCNFESNTLIILSVPMILKTKKIQVLIAALLNYFCENDNKILSINNLIQFIVEYLKNDTPSEWKEQQALLLLIELEKYCPNVIESPPASLLQIINIEKILKKLQNENF